ncbi:Dynein light chain Tctex-type 1 isoform 2 [Schistosoma japonicum]|uniref:Dynein light chain Tctex-type 3 n=2 Tax=Schistosoma japonicum TaxID=6182 RepID=A0A4Z2DP40_SCHJA|nr:Dynein light chain Tctex-type 1 isoform 2 [Schistosoma japonicum]
MSELNIVNGSNIFKFSPEETETIIKKCIQNIIGSNAYTSESAKEWAKTIVDNCRNDLVKLGKPFKYVGKFKNQSINCTITQKPGTGVYSAASCYWDTTKDGNCKVKWENNHVYCIVVVFALSL